MNNYTEPIWVIISGIAAILIFIPLFDFYYKIGSLKLDFDENSKITEGKITERDRSVLLTLILAVIATGTLEYFLFLNVKGTGLVIQMIFGPFAELSIVFFITRYLGLKRRKNNPFDWEKAVDDKELK